MLNLSERRVWYVIVLINVLACAFALLCSLLGAPATNVFAGLSTFVYFETLLVVTWYTFETRRMQESVTHQAKLIANSLRGNLQDSMRESMMEINKLFLARPLLRPYFYENKVFVPDPQNVADTELYYELSSIADCFLDIFESVKLSIEEFPDKVPDYLRAWENYIRSVFETSPFLGNHLRKHPEWYVHLDEYQCNTKLTH